MLSLDNIIRGLFEAAVITFAFVTILSTASIITVDEEWNVAEASVIDSAVYTPDSVEWYQINDVMVPVEFIEFPPLHISGGSNLLYNEQE